MASPDIELRVIADVNCTLVGNVFLVALKRAMSQLVIACRLPVAGRSSASSSSSPPALCWLLATCSGAAANPGGRLPTWRLRLLLRP